MALHRKIRKWKEICDEGKAQELLKSSSSSHSIKSPYHHAQKRTKKIPKDGFISSYNFFGINVFFISFANQAQILKSINM
jgi:hypothetical protein